VGVGDLWHSRDFGELVFVEYKLVIKIILFTQRFADQYAQPAPAALWVRHHSDLGSLDFVLVHLHPPLLGKLRVLENNTHRKQLVA
jgi:hypothetical protein